MTTHGPSTTLKHEAAILDQSHLLEESWRTLARNFLTVVLIAVSSWLLTSVMRWCVEQGAEHLFEPFSKPHESLHAAWILMAVLVIAGLVRGMIIRLPSWSDSDGDGAGKSLQYFIHTYSTDESRHQATEERYRQPTFMRALRRMVMTVLTIGSGGSGGIEGPVIPIGESLGSGWSRIFHVQSADNLRAFQMAGIAAAVATLLNAPFTAAIFAAEIVFTDRIVYRTLFYSLLAAIIAYALNNHFLHFQPLFSIHGHPPIYSPREYLEVSLVAIFCSAPAGLGVHYVFGKLQKMLAFVPIVLRAAVGALLAGSIAMALWFGLGIEPRHVLGVGESTMRAVLNGFAGPLLSVWWILLLLVLAKCVNTGLTLMAGGSAGLLIPAMFMGGLMGAAAYYLMIALGIPAYANNPDLFVVAGIASSLVAVIEVPLAAIAFVMEVFGANFGPPAIVACVVCHMFVKRFKLYVEK